MENNNPNNAGHSHTPIYGAIAVAIAIAIIGGGIAYMHGGVPGAVGALGANGIPGSPGISGSQGPSGANGTNGLNGSQGPQGPTGPQGPSGANGSSGSNGANGSNGTDGRNGSNGSGVPAVNISVSLHLNYSAALLKTCNYCVGAEWQNDTINFTTTEDASFVVAHTFHDTNSTWVGWQMMNVTSGFTYVAGPQYGNLTPPPAGEEKWAWDNATWIFGAPTIPGTYDFVITFCVGVY